MNGAASIVTNLQYELVAIQGGEITIPPAKIALINPVTGQREEISTKPVIISVSGGRKPAQAVPTAVITPEPEEDIKEIKTSLGFDAALAVTIAVLVLVFIAAVLAAWKFIFAAKKPLQPASDERFDYRAEAMKMAEKALRKLASGDIKGYYYEIYEAVRYYLSAHLGEPYAELTTQEIITRIRPKLSEGKTARIAQFMSDCDMVKFADFRSPAAEANEAGRRAAEIIEKT